MRRVLVLALVCCLSILVGCTRRQPAPVIRPINVTDVDPEQIVPGEQSVVTIRATNLEQVAEVAGLPTGSKVGSLNKATPGMLSFSLTIPETQASSISMVFENAEDAIIPTQRPVSLRVVTPVERVRVELQTMITTANSDLERRLNESFKTTSEELAEKFTDALGPLRTDVDTQGRRITSLENRATQQADTLTKVQSQLTQTDGRVIANSQQIGTMKQELADAIESFNNLRTELASLREAQSRSDSRTKQLEDSFAAYVNANRQLWSYMNVIASAMAEAEVPKPLWLGDEHIVPEETRRQLENFATTTPPPAPRTSIQVIPGTSPRP
jgi:uncharacterized coiled-coil protein SlyX